jgi:LmbE family N-acetylglucosaminyl deacetylase
LKAIAAVAHPDDCVIFARPYIDAHPEYEWHIVYLTYAAQDPRAQEVAAYWTARGVTTEFLGFRDDYEDQKTQRFNFWSCTDALTSLINACNAADLIVTHYEDGDYGHIHHKLVNRAVRKLAINQVYFASTFNYNTRYIAKDNLPLDQFPLHRDVIEQFSDINCGLYIEQK